MGTAPQLTSNDVVLARTSCTRAGPGGFSAGGEGGEGETGQGPCQAAPKRARPGWSHLDPSTCPHIQSPGPPTKCQAMRCHSSPPHNVGPPHLR